jgi:hypothetical protein
MLKTLMALAVTAGIDVSIAPDSVKVTGPLPPADATAAIQKQLPTLTACVPEGLKKEVVITLKLAVMSDGQVSTSSVSGGGVSADAAVNGKFTDCVMAAADEWKFPARKTAGVSDVRVGIAVKGK